MPWACLRFYKSKVSTNVSWERTITGTDCAEPAAGGRRSAPLSTSGLPGGPLTPVIVPPEGGSPETTVQRALVCTAHPTRLGF